MRASELKEFLIYSIKNRFPVLIKGIPGIGKSDLVDQACHACAELYKDNTKLIISHPVVSDPTDYKGLPFLGEGGIAHFAPFGELNELVNATVPTVFFLDDLGQAPASVQAACMQLLLARRINGHKVSDFVTFIAATNGKGDKAGVSGMLEPVKSRFKSIVELDVNADDWCKWAIQNNMPIELIAFIRFKPVLLSKFEPTKDITNTPSPRTVANIGHLQNAGLSKAIEAEVFSGAAGQGFATEYRAFLKMYRELPNIDQVILAPMKAQIPTEPGVLYAMAGALAAKMTENTMEPICQYLDRIPGEIAVVSVKDGITRDLGLTQTKAYAKWAVKNGDLMS